MTPIQKIQVRMSETREKLNGMPEIRVDDADKLAEREKLTAELKAQEVELRAAIEADGDTTPETREWADVSSRFDLGEMFTAVTEHRASAGAIAEVQKESSGPHHQDSGEAKIRESTAGVSRKPSSDGKARGSSSKHLCGLTAWNT